MVSRSILFVSALALLTSQVAGHGYMTYPPTRHLKALDANGPSECPECTIIEPVPAWPNLGSAAVGKGGPCGFNERSGSEYNSPSDIWGDVVATFERGQEIPVQWCVDNNGDHAGAYSYRVCRDQNIVNKFITPGYTPNEAEKQEAEDCFQRGILACYDVSGQECRISPDCQDSGCQRNDWFACESFYGGRCKSLGKSAEKIQMKYANSTCDANGFREECGYMGIGETECLGNGCCWDERDGAPWCFRRNSEQESEVCDNNAFRSDCGFVGITENDCRSKACCWDPKEGSPYCFYPNNGEFEPEPSSCRTTISQGYPINNKVKIPTDITSNHTLLSWRWDSFETPQVYMTCADIAIV